MWVGLVDPIAFGLNARSPGRSVGNELFKVCRIDLPVGMKVESSGQVLFHVIRLNTRLLHTSTFAHKVPSRNEIVRLNTP